MIERDGKAVGVELKSGVVNADIVVINADLPYAFEKLLPEDSATAPVLDMVPTCGSINFYWALKETFPLLRHHTVFFSGSYQDAWDDIFKRNRVPSKPNFYIHAASRTGIVWAAGTAVTRADPSCAPLGGDTLMILVPVSVHAAAGVQRPSLSRC